MIELRRAIELVEQAKKDWDAATRQPFNSQRYTEWRAAYSAGEGAAKETLVAVGATIRNDSVGGVALRLAGIRSVSTTGIGGAMSNWLIRARARRDGEAPRG